MPALLPARQPAGRSHAKITMTIVDHCLRMIVPTIAIVTTVVSSAHGQGQVVPPGSVHHLHSANMQPGSVAKEQLIRDASFRGYYQPVKLYGPQGSSISMVINGQFEKPRPSPVKVGILIGKVYRFRMTGIRRQEGFEVFPSIELINRMYPPRGQATQFPIPIELTEEDLSLAISGRYVTRVIYLENPRTALALEQKSDTQRYFEIAPDQDPLQVADELGRPMAILRLGSRTPAEGESILSFSYGSPPLLIFPERFSDKPAELKQIQQAHLPRPNSPDGGSAR